MFGITIKNMLKNKFLTVCLMVGFILSASVVSTVPVYANGVLDEFLHSIFKSAEIKVSNDPKDEYQYPAAIAFSKQVRFNTSYKTFLNSYNSLKTVLPSIAQQIPIPSIAQKLTLAYDNISYRSNEINKQIYSSNNSIVYVSDFTNHISLTKGKLPGDTLSKDNCIDVMVDESTFNNFFLQLDSVYEVTNITQDLPLKMKVTGVFKPRSAEDPYWRDRGTNFYCKYFVTESAFMSIYESNENLASQIKTINFSVLYDYNSINNKNARKVNTAAETVSKTSENRLQTSVNCTITKNLKEYLNKEQQYTLIIWMFLIPVLIVIIYYIVMISGFLADADKDQIAVLKSRGAGISEIIRIYLYEGTIISLVSIFAGPFLGMLLGKVIGYADGFMSFGGNNGIQISLSYSAFLFSLLTVLILLVTLMLSVYLASRRTIVEVKRNKNKYLSVVLKFKNADIILLILSSYGYYLYGGTKNVPSLSAASTANVPMDPLLYLLSTVFILGAGLFFLRLYRYTVKLISILLNILNLPIYYLTFTNILRHHLKKISVMLFVILIVSLGIFNMSIAKNINMSYENTVKYMSGADIIVQGVWGRQLDNLPGADEYTENYYKYFEPDYSEFSKVQGIEQYTKVLRIPSGTVGHANSGTMNISTNILGIIPHEFGKVAWFDSSLLKIHWYYYLNAMTNRKDLVLISKGLSSSGSINKGDTLELKLEAGRSVKVKVYDIIDYWPGCDNLKNKNLVVTNLNYVFSNCPVIPYEIWMKKKNGVKDSLIYDSFRNEKIALQSFKDISVDEYKARNDIFLKGTNAVLTLGFTSITCVCIIGFIIYWMLSLKSRTLHFGVYRTLGISSGKVSAILFNEQIFTLGSAVLIGIAVGKITGSLFIPLIQQIWYSNKYVIPVKNISYFSEYIQFAALLAVLFFITLLLLFKYVSTLKINQAVKLGED